MCLLNVRRQNASSLPGSQVGRLDTVRQSGLSQAVEGRLSCFQVGIGASL